MAVRTFLSPARRADFADALIAARAAGDWAVSLKEFEGLIQSKTRGDVAGYTNIVIATVSTIAAGDKGGGTITVTITGDHVKPGIAIGDLIIDGDVACGLTIGAIAAVGGNASFTIAYTDAAGAGAVAGSVHITVKPSGLATELYLNTNTVEVVVS